ncbi:MAG: radical SAM protein [Acidobacteria bacterium]|nr:radical SAM protein [Acidobacteriota bacterium]
MDPTTRTASPPEEGRETLTLSQYLEWEEFRVHNPHTNLSLESGDAAWGPLREILAGAPLSMIDPSILGRITSERWLVDRSADLSTRYHLRLVSLETVTTCNQKCYFCPVSIAPREDVEMPPALFDRILDQLTAYRSTLEGVFLQSYNEPTIDRRFVPQCHQLLDAQLPVAILTNASGLTPKRVDEILTRGKLRYIAVNLSTLDRARYAADRGADHLVNVLRNVDYLSKNPIATEMRIVVLGQGDDTHRSDFDAIRERYDGTPFAVTFHTVMDRAGYLDLGAKPAAPHVRLRGCDNIGSRPIQHLHITPAGLCVLCCQDYDENYVVGDLSRSSIDEVMSGPEMARMRRWAYGIEEAPDNFICRNCVFAKSEPIVGRTPASE